MRDDYPHNAERGPRKGPQRMLGGPRGYLRLIGSLSVQRASEAAKSASEVASRASEANQRPLRERRRRKKNNDNNDNDREWK